MTSPDDRTPSFEELARALPRIAEAIETSAKQPGVTAAGMHAFFGIRRSTPNHLQ